METSLSKMIQVRIELFIPKDAPSIATFHWEVLDEGKDLVKFIDYTMTEEEECFFGRFMDDLGMVIFWGSNSMEREGLKFLCKPRSSGWTVWILMLPHFRWPYIAE